MSKCEKSTHEFAASLKPFSIAGIKPDGIACPTIMFSNSNFSLESDDRGSTYLATVTSVFEKTLGLVYK